MNLKVTPDQILSRMEIKGEPRVYVIGSLERRVTVYSQQMRALNLVYSLFSSGRLREGQSVAVVGGGIAGLTFGAGAAVKGCSVTVLEQRDDLVPLQANCDKRWIHPHVYDWPKRDSLRPDTDDLELLTWKAARAGDVAEEILRGWQSVKASTGRILEYLGVRSVALMPPKSERRLLTWGPGAKFADFDVVVIAVGFGLEKTINGITCHSYWRDDELDQDELEEHKSFLVSGIGDGGLTDVLRCVFPRFRHHEFVRQLGLDQQDNISISPLVKKILRIEDEAVRRHDAQEEESSISRFLTEEYRSLHVDSIDIDAKFVFNKRRTVVLNGPSPFPHTLAASPLNRFLVSRLIDLGKIEYWPGTLTGAKQNLSGGWTIGVDGGSPREFHRVIIRHGTTSALHAAFPNIAKVLSAGTGPDLSRCKIWPENWFSSGFGVGAGRTQNATSVGDTPPVDLVRARDITILEHAKSSLWTKIFHATGISTESSEIRKDQSMETESSYDVYVVEEPDSKVKLVFCAKAPRNPVPIELIQRANLHIDTRFPGGITIVSLDELLPEVADTARSLKKNGKPLQILGVADVVMPMQPAAPAILEKLTMLSQTPFKVEILIAGDEWHHLLFDSLRADWIQIHKSDGALVPASDPLVQRLRERRTEFALARYGLPESSIDSRVDSIDEFNRQAYLAACKREYQRVKYHALSLIGMRLDDRIRLEKLYIENEGEATDTGESSAIVDHLIEDQLGPLAESSVLRDHLRKQVLSSINSGISGSRDRLQAYFRQNQLLAIVGDPGSGKSVSVKREILRYCDPVEGRIHTPIFVSLSDAVRQLEGVREMGDGGRSSEVIYRLLAAASEQAQRLQLPITFENVKHLESRGDLALFLDGFDEVSDQQVRFAILDAVKRLAERAESSGNRIVLTSRPGALRSAPLPRGMQIVHVTPFSIGDIQRLSSFLLRIRSDANAIDDFENAALGTLEQKALQTLIRDCHTNRSIMRLAQNPFLLTMLVGVYLNGGGRIAMRRHGIYQDSIRILTHVRNRQLGQHVPSSSDVDLALSSVAVKALDRPGSAIDTGHVVDIVFGAFEGSASREEVQVLLEQADNAGLIDFRPEPSGFDGGRTTFRHFSFLEYFASIYIEKRGVEEIISAARSPLWHNAGLLAAARTSERGSGSDLIKVLMSKTTSDVERLTGRGIELALELADEMADIPSSARKVIAATIRDHLSSGALRSSAALRDIVGKRLGEILGATGEPAIQNALAATINGADDCAAAAAIDLVGNFPEDIEVRGPLLDAIVAASGRNELPIADACLGAMGKRKELRTEAGVSRLVKQLSSRSPTRKYSALHVVESVPSFYPIVEAPLHACLEDRSRALSGIAGRVILRCLADSGRELNLDDADTLSLVGMALERWGDIARPGASKHISLEVPQDQIRDLLQGSLQNRLIGIRLLPWVANAEDWILEKVREHALQTTDEVERKAAGLAVLAMKDSPRRLFQHRDFDHIDEVAVRGTDRRLRIAALRALGATRGGVDTASRLMERLRNSEQRIETIEHKLIVNALCKSGRNNNGVRDYIHNEARDSLKHWSGGRNQPYALTWIQACQDFGAEVDGEIYNHLLRLSQDYKVPRRVRSTLFRVWTRLHPMDERLVKTMVGVLGQRNTAIFEDACSSLGSLVERVRSDITLLEKSEQLLRPLRNAVLQAARGVLLRAKEEPDSDHVEHVRRALRETEDILLSAEDYLRSRPVE